MVALVAQEEDDDSGHFRPDPWKEPWEATQDVLAPSCEVKAAADSLVWAELAQQAMGWMVLTQIGLLLGSFGQIMSLSVCLLSWWVFMLEAMLKYARRWAHNHFFMDVPCAYVSIHRAKHDLLAVFGISLLTAVVFEVALYVPMIVSVFTFFHEKRRCFPTAFADNNPNECPPGINLLVVLLFLCVATLILHCVSSIVTTYRFHSAVGVGVVFQEKRRKLKEILSWPGSQRQACRCNEKGCSARKKGNSPRSDYDRILCLSWWVHLARHSHLSAVVASAQPGTCGLPGHWFKSVAQLKRIVVECVVSEDHNLTSAGPMWVSQEMALRALVSLAKQDNDEISGEILGQDGFNLLIQVVRDAKVPRCRGLAAASIAVLASQHDVIKKAQVDLTTAVIPLKRLLRSKDHELKEVALGALLNAVLNDEQCVKVAEKILSSDGIVVVGSRGSFISVVMEQAHLGQTARCQELATGLLVRLAGNSTLARNVLMEIDNSKLNGLELLIELLQFGLTTDVKASAAGVLAELAFKDKLARQIARGPYGEICIRALVNELRSGPRIAYASARALCNLGLKWIECKPSIVSAGGIQRFVELLEERDLAMNNDFNTRIARSPVMTEEQEQVHAVAAKALSMLAFGNSTNQDLIVSANAIPRLVILLRNPMTKVRIQAVAALSALAWRNERYQELIGKDGDEIFPQLVQILGEIDDEKMEDIVLRKVAIAIRSFADGNMANKDAILQAGAREQLESLLQMRLDRDKDKTDKEKALEKAIRQAVEVLDG